MEVTPISRNNRPDHNRRSTDFWRICRTRMLPLLAFLAAALLAVSAAGAPPSAIRTYGTFVLEKTGQIPKTKEQWNQWLRQNWHGPDGQPETFTVGKNGATTEVGDCRQLFVADRRGQTLTQAADRMIYRGWATNCYAARLIRNAKAARTSHLTAFRFDRTHVDRLPAAMRFVVSPSDRDNAQHKTLGPFLRKAKMTFSNGSEGHYVHITYPDGGTQIIALLARGDFDHDGNDDLLLRSYNRSNGGGSYAVLALYLVSRSSHNTAMRLIRQIPVMGPDYEE